MDRAVCSQSYEVCNFGRALLFEAKTLKKRDRTQAYLFNAGCILLDRMSLTSLKVSGICHEAGVAHGTFYIYFQNRQVFIESLLLRFVDYLQKMMRQASKSGTGDSAHMATTAYFNLFEQNTGLMKCLVNHLEEFPDPLAAFQKLNREWAEIVVVSTERKLVQSDQCGKISHDELFRRAYALGGMVDQYLSALLLTDDPSLKTISRDKDEVIDTLSLIWKRGMAV